MPEVIHNFMRMLGIIAKCLTVGIGLVLWCKLKVGWHRAKKHLAGERKRQKVRTFTGEGIGVVQPT